MNIRDNEPEIVRPGIFVRLRGWFFTGLLVTAPVLLTVYITWAAIELIDSLFHFANFDQFAFG